MSPQWPHCCGLDRHQTQGDTHLMVSSERGQSLYFDALNKQLLVCMCQIPMPPEPHPHCKFSTQVFNLVLTVY